MTETTEKKPLSKKMTNYLVYTAAAVVLVLVFVLLFGGGGKETEENPGVNTELPEPSERRQSMNDKKEQYEDFDERRSFDDNLFNIFEEATREETAGRDINPSEDRHGGSRIRNQDDDPFESLQRGLEENKESLDALQENIDARREGRIPEEETANATGTSVATSNLSIENEGLKQQLKLQQEATDRLNQIIQRQEEERVAREKRYEENVEAQKRKKNTSAVRPIASQGKGVVSTLCGGSFQGLGGGDVAGRNTIKASVYGKQTVTVGQQVRLRLMEPMQVGTTVLPTGSIVSGTVGIGIDRIYLTITHIVYQQTLMAVDLEAYDMDGQRGLFVPDNMENEAIRDLFIELTQSMSSTMTQGTSSFINTEKAIEQLKSDLARGAVQGLGNFIRKKLEKVKITVSDSHNVLLYGGDVE